MTGSKTQKELDTLQMQTDLINSKYKETEQEINVANTNYTSAKSQVEKDIIKQRLDELIEKLIPRTKERFSSWILFALNHPDSYVSPYFLSNPIKAIPLDSAKAIFYKLTSRIQNSASGKNIAKYFEQIDKNAIGKTPYNFSVADINGSNVSLAKFKDKYIYIDFWASWCIPCREAIPHLKLLFDKYYDKGFEVITISIDKDSNKWKEAVVAENLTKWHNLLVTKEIEDNYDNVQNAIPSGILISNAGKIVWKSSSEEKLEDALKRFFK
jgi:thiol-disulfide isomerase/thioredoxin